MLACNFYMALVFIDSKYRIISFTIFHNILKLERSKTLKEISKLFTQVGPSVLNAGAQDFKGSDAKMSIIVGAMAVSDLVKSTLGPKGMVCSNLDLRFGMC